MRPWICLNYQGQVMLVCNTFKMSRRSQRGPDEANTQLEMSRYVSYFAAYGHKSGMRPQQVEQHMCSRPMSRSFPSSIGNETGVTGKWKQGLKPWNWSSALSWIKFTIPRTQEWCTRDVVLYSNFLEWCLHCRWIFDAKCNGQAENAQRSEWTAFKTYLGFASSNGLYFRM